MRFQVAISDILARSSFALCNSAFADRSVMAASRLLGPAVARAILLSFAAGPRTWYWSGSIKVAKVICQQVFSILALVIFLLQFLLKSASKSSFVCLGTEIQFVSCNFWYRCAKRLACVKASLCTGFSA